MNIFKSKRLELLEDQILTLNKRISALEAVGVCDSLQIIELENDKKLLKQDLFALKNNIMSQFDTLHLRVANLEHGKRWWEK